MINSSHLFDSFNNEKMMDVLNKLREFNIEIDPSSQIDETTLQMICAQVEGCMDPIVKELQGRTDFNFNIKIGANCEIDERVEINPGVSIGDNTKIGKKTGLLEGVQIGKDCVIGNSVWIQKNCHIGDKSIICDHTVFAPEFTVAAESLVLPESAECEVESYMAKVKQRIDLV